MKVIYIKPNEKPVVIDIKNKLEDLQKAVGGLIEIVDIDNGICTVSNEESKLLNMPPNRTLPNGIVLHGNFLICGFDDEGDLTSLGDREIDFFMNFYADPETFDEDYEPDMECMLFGF